MIKKFANCGEYNFGDLIRTQRLEKGLSMRELSDRTGFTVASISRWESKKRIPSVESFNAVMAALGAELYVVEK